MPAKLLILSFTILQFTMSTITFAQARCDASSIDRAEEYYAIGKLNECIDSLTNCLKQRGFTAGQQVRAYKLIAMSYLAMDLKNNADSAIQSILYQQPDFAADEEDPERFKSELSFVRSHQNTTVVSSVSKRPEDIRLAPATAAVVTQQEILERGYTDLIDILKDIPGFDISIYYGQTYANIYQRGFRTNNTDKTLLLIDGIEDNDLWSNFADISQQYPITNIKQVEIVYGPSSTMYGPNAFSGVINIITKDAKDYLHNNHPFGLQFNAGTGTYNTKYFDLSAAYKKGIFSITVTGRLYNSDRPDLSSDTLFDYDPVAYSAFSPQTKDVLYKRRFQRIAGGAYLDSNHISYPATGTASYNDPNGMFVLNYDSLHRPATLTLTDSGAHVARRLDSLTYISQAYSRFNNPASSFYLSTKINVGNYSFGLVSWTKNEGAGTTYTDRVFSVNGTSWKPQHYYIYSNFSQSINHALNVTISSNYRVHRIADGSEITGLGSYLKGYLDLGDLENRMPVSLYTTYYFEQSQQFRSEVKLTYSKGKNFGFVGGIEVRSGLFQKYYLTDTLPDPQTTGTSKNDSGSNFYTVKDAGIYGQATWRTQTGLGFTTGVRIDNNTIKEAKGLGTTISPRLVVDYSIRDWVFKMIYSNGIQNISSYTKFDDIIANRDTSSRSTLEPEKIHNYELYISKPLSKKIFADADGYFSDIDNVVSAIVNGSTKKNANIGEFRIWGTQINIIYKTKNFQFTLNHAFTRPRQTKGIVTNIENNNASTYLTDTSKAVADIATNKVNTIMNYTFLKKYNINIRANYVSGKKVGPNTSVPNNLLPPFPGYLLSNASFTIDHPFKLSGASLQFNCNNIFDKEYYSPGIRAAGGLNYPNQIRQMGRNFSLKFTYEL